LAGVVVLGAAIVFLVLVPAVRKVREAADRTTSQNNLHLIGLAMHNYHDSHKSFPPPVQYGPDNKPLLSWRVLILPYLEQDNLFHQFHLDEPWDSPHNSQFLDMMPKVYASPTQKSTQETHYLVFDGPQCIFNRHGAPGRMSDIKDGTSDTILVVEADKAVPWTKPEDLPYGPEEPLPELGGLYSGGVFLVARADGAVYSLSRNRISGSTLRAAITANGGEELPEGWWNDQH
jgi:hypothetical protein